ncbi:uncharacterized protein DS421_6g188730 [Arachis hypogaea]|nr:uncharacterized protein DS421_6g188730 [Arachis hypogaea]
MPVSYCSLASSVRNRLQVGVQCQKHVTTWRSTPETSQAREKLKSQPSTHQVGPRSEFLHQLS